MPGQIGARVRVALTTVGALVLILLVGGAAFHVPPGELASDGRRIVGPGWHIRTALTGPTRFSASGGLSVSLAHQHSKEGARLAYRIRAEYAANPTLLSAHARVLARGGVNALSEQVVAGLKSYLAGRSGGEFRSGALPAGLEEPFEDAFQHVGLDVRDLRLEAESRTDPEAAASTLSVENRAAMPTGAKVLLIGLDGADWDLARPLMDRGQMPHLASLASRGATGTMLSYDPMMSPLLWTTVVTGVGADRHGVADFLVYSGGSDRRLPITSTFRKVPALWNIASEAGLSVGFSGWWASFPAERVRGYLASDLLPFQVRHKDRPAPSGITFPEAYYSEIASKIRAPSDVPTQLIRSLLRVSPAEIEEARREANSPSPDTPSPKGEAPVPFSLRVVSAGLAAVTVGEDLVRRDLDLVGVYFEGIDLFGHRFQHCLPPRMALCPDEEWERFREAVPSFYRLQDAWLGRILDAAGPEWTILLLSDHGFRTGDSRPDRILPFTSGQPVEWHEKEGIFVAAGPAVAPGDAGQVTLFDITPTILALLGLSVAEDLPGRVLAQVLDPTWLRDHPVRHIPSFGSRQAPMEQVEKSEASADLEAREDLLRTLRGLGYVGDGYVGDEEVGQPQRSQEGAAALPGEGGPRPTVAYFRNLATYHLRRREFPQAEANLRRSMDVRPLPKTYHLLAETVLEQGRPDEALEALEDGMKRFPDLATDDVLWGVEILTGAGRVEEARAFLARNAERAGRRPGLEAACLGLVDEALGRTEAAVEEYLAALEADPTRTVAARRLLPILAARGRADAIEPYLRRAVRQQQRSDEAWGLLGALRGMQGRPQEAVAALSRALEIDPGNAGYARNLAVALGTAGRHQEAARAFEVLLRLTPEDSRGWLGLGTARRLSGDPRGSQAAFERALALAPDSTEAILGRALAQRDAGSVAEARRTVSEGLLHHPGHGGLLRLDRELRAAEGS